MEVLDTGLEAMESEIQGSSLGERVGGRLEELLGRTDKLLSDARRLLQAREPLRWRL